MTDWQPLDTAPTGETVLLAWKFGLGVSLGHKNDDGGFISQEGTDWGNGAARFSHWAPEPETPFST